MIDDREALAPSPAHELALDCVEAGIAAAHPHRVVGDRLHLEGDQLRVEDELFDLGAFDEVVVLGGGKAAAQVAAALEDVLGDRLDGGVVVTNDPVETECVTVREGDHPVPSERGVEAAQAVRDAADAADDETLVLAVLTGGGSALLPAPADGLDLADLQSVTESLLDAGAPIEAVNAARKHCSAIKGGQLARAADPATVCTLLFSDVVGDDPGVIASGPTVPDPTTFADARQVLSAYDVDAPEAVTDRIERGIDGEIDETPTADDPIFEKTSTHVLANGRTAIDAARETAQKADHESLVLAAGIEGEAREVARTHAAVATEAVERGDPVEPPAVVVSGGETTVTVRGDGRGGPNCEFALSAARSLPDGAVLAAVDTDGLDGASEVAGAVVDAETVADDEAAGQALADNDAAGFLADRDALVDTGPTGTNVNDLHVLVVDGA
ncbi:glycerate kinase type-2 family protein [Halorientalis halophila]|uniref:glycerate kinase type-2 family protein n=1 Tax=Halorientalis halophila TaxID=3108499 RepID=UPI00300B9804